MPSPPIRRLLAILALALAFAAPRASDAGQHIADPRSSAGAAAQPLNVLSRLWGFLTNVWSETGCRMDPNGHCLAQADTPPAVTRLDEGCMMDPNGRCPEH